MYNGKAYTLQLMLPLLCLDAKEAKIKDNPIAARVWPAYARTSPCGGIVY